MITSLLAQSVDQNHSENNKKQKVQCKGVPFHSVKAH